MPSGRPLDSEAKAKRREALERYATKYTYFSIKATVNHYFSEIGRFYGKPHALECEGGELLLWTTLLRRNSGPLLGARGLNTEKKDNSCDFARSVIGKKFALPTSCVPKKAAEQARVERLKRRRAAAERKKGKQSQGTQHPFLRQQRRYDPNEVLTANQIRCRALRRDQLELDNGDDSDEDVPPGMCGCVRTQCQLLHKNETQSRKDWKIFHLKYPNV
ncbi:hypothetical protein C8F04DRAFT_1274601 [Mycena alexandri]|uniref:Uncharacterized protein n=1 Tax=Mycena alexandri TaxID=1745969 RepID=A0AAD6WPY9_9AGAR|nr:hypothetical protein C8F04DRAFT_1274601 [Mycena alexandri]